MINQITVNSLFMNKKGEMFTVSNIVKAKSKGLEVLKVEYYPISDTGMINTSKVLKCKVDDIGTKFKLLDYKF